MVCKKKLILIWFILCMTIIYPINSYAYARVSPRIVYKATFDDSKINSVRSDTLGIYVDGVDGLIVKVETRVKGCAIVVQFRLATVGSQSRGVFIGFGDTQWYDATPLLDSGIYDVDLMVWAWTGPGPNSKQVSMWDMEYNIQYLATMNSRLYDIETGGLVGSIMQTWSMLPPELYTPYQFTITRTQESMWIIEAGTWFRVNFGDAYPLGYAWLTFSITITK